MFNKNFKFTNNSEKGAVAPIMALLFLFVLIPIAALAIDLAFLYVARNELQNAADAGAMAGTRNLYINNGQTINANANQIAYDAAKQNSSMGKSVDINWVSPQNSTPGTPKENWHDIERGHWSFGRGNINKGFTPNNSTTAINIWEYDNEGLDDNLNFINAVRVVARREATPVTAFFSRLFGYTDFTISAESIAYLGFSGSVEPEGFDYPIAICKQSLFDELGGPINCNIGRMLEDNTTGDTAVWTNFTQPCATSATPSIRSTMDPCGKGNSSSLTYGQGIGVTNGVVDTVFSSLLSSSGNKGCPDPTTNNHSFENCWKLENNDNISLCPSDSEDCGKPTKPWPMRLPVVDCSLGAPNCRPLVGAVVVNVLWISRDSHKPDADAPCSMDGWTSDSTDGLTRWNSFVSHFNIQTSSGDPAPFSKKTVYFAPDCEVQLPTGLTGGDNFGILAEIPVLVK
jgi:hypothetical protein